MLPDKAVGGHLGESSAPACGGLSGRAGGVVNRNLSILGQRWEL